MTLGGNGADGADKTAGWKYGEKAKSKERRRLEAACREIGVLWVDQLVEADDFLVELGADATDEQISKRRHASKNERWPNLGPSVGLG